MTEEACVSHLDALRRHCFGALVSQKPGRAAYPPPTQEWTLSGASPGLDINFGVGSRLSLEREASNEIGTGIHQAEWMHIIYRLGLSALTVSTWESIFLPPL